MVIWRWQRVLVCCAVVMLASCSGDAKTGGVLGDVAFWDVEGASDVDVFDDAQGGDDVLLGDVEFSEDSGVQVDVAIGPGVDAEAVDSGELDGPCGVEARGEVGVPELGANWRYGGGDGYPDVVRRDDRCMTVVATKAELLGALSGAQRGEIVYVDDGASIDLSGESVCVPGGVWLASGRGVGNSPGALLYTTKNERPPVLKVCGDGVRITGLRLLGADGGTCPAEWPDNCKGADRTGGVNCRDCMLSTEGIGVRGFDQVEIDNTEVAGFSHAGIYLSDAVDVHIHHNDIHHTQRAGLGYGVVLMRGGRGNVTTLIEWNRFDYFRHVIAGSGEPGQSYHARNNYTGPNASGHVFDMHGENENTNNGSAWAGGRIEIHGNIVLAGNYYAMVIRGKPKEGVWLYDNCLAQANASKAASQYSGFPGNFHVDSAPDGASMPNRYGMTANVCESVRMCYWAGGTGPRKTGIKSVRDASKLGFADLDGDGKTDVFYADGTKWEWARSGTSSWKTLNSSTYVLKDLALGDFNGDGKDDVFSIHGGEWRVSDGGVKRWRTLRAGNEDISTLLFGDFDGDGITDVFRATGSTWQWSRSGTAAWADLRSSTVRVEALAVGDFNGDGKDDIFVTSGGKWSYSAGGKGALVGLNHSNMARKNLYFGDFDGDGKTDVLLFSGDEWLVSWRGTSKWQRLRLDGAPRGPVKIGDFDGDGKADVFETHCL